MRPRRAAGHGDLQGMAGGNLALTPATSITIGDQAYRLGLRRQNFQDRLFYGSLAFVLEQIAAMRAMAQRDLDAVMDVFITGPLAMAPLMTALAAWALGLFIALIGWPGKRSSCSL